MAIEIFDLHEARAFGSVVNRALERRGVVPEVGMGATELCWSDRHAGTIVAVGCIQRGPRAGQPVRVAWQRDRAESVGSGGPGAVQRYAYHRDQAAPVAWFTLRKNGRWIRQGESMAGGTSLAIGRRDEYFDWSF